MTSAVETPLAAHDAHAGIGETKNDGGRAAGASFRRWSVGSGTEGTGAAVSIRTARSRAGIRRSKLRTMPRPDSVDGGGGSG